MQPFPGDMSDSDYFKMAKLKRSQQKDLADLVYKLKKQDRRDRKEKQRKTLWGKIKLFFGF